MGGKLEELTNKIYQEGVTKANHEAEKIVNEANLKAEKIVSDAKKEAEDIINNANTEAKDTKSKVENELKQSYQQTLRHIQQEITNLIVAEVTKDPLKNTFKDTEFIKKVIETALKSWLQDQSKTDLVVLLPADKEQELAQYFEAHTKELLNGTLNVEVDSELKSGFKIGPADGSYQITFKEEDFQNLFIKYLRPKTIDLLFGKNKSEL